jgi:hypothetical protein
VVGGATSTPTATGTAGPVQVGGVADVHIGGGPGSGAAATSSGDSGTGYGYAMAFSLAGAIVSMAAGGWYLRRRVRE